ncbi:interferon-activable protein 203-like [Vicugna pacos]|uniref:Interferon-activable protein 203-like n=1 Tax=Vicugna pacos TaxID=30538 RepID=A0A6J3AXP1_VICPA
MANEFKKILLLKGLQHIDDYNFRLVKSLLHEDLNLTTKTQDEYNRIKIADLMAKKFKGAACVDKRIEFIKDIESLKDIVKTLRNEKSKVKRKSKANETTPGKDKQDKPSTSTTNKALGPKSTKRTPVKKIKTTKTNEAKRMRLTQKQNPLPGTSGTSKQSAESLLQTPPVPPLAPSSSSSTKRKYEKTTKTNDLKKKMLSQKQSQLPETWATSMCPPERCGWTAQTLPPAPLCSSSIKQEEEIYTLPQKREDPTTTKTVNPQRIKLPLEQSQLPEPLTPSIHPPEGCFQTPWVLPPTPSSSPVTKKPKLKAVPKEASREEGFQRGPKEVMVLNATEPFIYDVREGNREMFHATVATESKFFQVKVYHVALKEKFIPKKIIAISDYVGRSGFLEIFHTLSVSDVNADRKMEIPQSLIRKANATPKISHLHLQVPGTFVNGVFQVHKKTVWNECIYYEVQDSTGAMEVLVYGRLTRILCEEGNKLKLICFELASKGEGRQLRSVIHSYIKVIKPRKNK